ncbi:Cys-Gln thioester bond-forming surface protein [Streptomyces sp. NPDC004609]|uniref:Cys-Gln thioester bond-forming surface protein n=1 Tax=Streptomyces sp. NPDC004609 TaxID=3364704 RepID=UPI0036BB186C
MRRSRSTVRRIAAAVAVTGLVATGSLMGAGAAAAADGPQHQGGAVATLDGLKTFDGSKIYWKGEEEPQTMNAGVFEMTVDGGGKLKTYCIDIYNPTVDDAKYQETPWEQTSLNSNENAGRILWILKNSYPEVDDLTALAAKAGTGPLTEKTAAAGTQVAIWRFSDDVKVTADDENAEKLATYLEKNAAKLQEPKASLTLDPNAVSGKPGSRLGPVTVQTNASSASLALSADAIAGGVKLVDEAGKPVTSGANGSKVFFDVPAGAADGTATLTAQATTSVPVGRAFAPAVGKSQTMILAGSSESTVTANATASWAKTGPIPAVTAEKNCAKGGVDVTASNKGDEPFTFKLAGSEHTIPAGGSKTVFVPVAEDQAYEITINGPDGFKETFKGVLDCKTSPPSDPEPENPSEPSPASAGGTSTSTSTSGGGGDLAATGSSNSTPLIAGIAIALVAVGGGAVFVLRKKKTSIAE